MKPFKDFLIKESVVEIDDSILLPEGFVYSEEPELEGIITEEKGGDPPAVLVMRRTAIRMFPNGQKIALYKVDKLNKFITVPYDDKDSMIMTTNK
jgi:hypothetical protein